MRYLMILFLSLTSSLLATNQLIIGIAGGTGSGKTTLAGHNRGNRRTRQC